MPKRIQRKRTKGWRMPPNTEYVGRPSKWGNRHRIGIDGDAETCVALFRKDCDDPVFVAAIKRELRGRDLAEWCPLDRPCHADVLLEIANA